MKKNQAIEVMQHVFEKMQNCDCEVKLINAETNETLEPDAQAIRAGMLAGIYAGITILNTDALPESKDDYMGIMSDIVGNAGRSYLTEHLSKQEAGVSNG